MLPKTPFIHQLPARIFEAQTRLSSMIWQVSSEPLKVSQSKPTSEHLTHNQGIKQSFTPVTQTPHYWGHIFDQCWWKVSIPVAKKGEGKRYLHWKDQGEATMYIQGEPIFGFDPPHPYAELPEGTKNVVIESMCFRSAYWFHGHPESLDAEGSKFEGAYLATRNDEAFHAHHDLQTLISIMRYEYTKGMPHDQEDRFSPAFGPRPTIEQISPLFRRLLVAADRAVDAFESKGPTAMRRVLKPIFDEFKSDIPIDIILTGHAHIDLVWLWPEKAGEFKAVHSFAINRTLLEKYPEAVFGYSQPASYRAVETRSPKLMESVRKQIKRGAWDPVGATEVESDTQLACGEALIRSFELGQAGFEDIQGRPSRVLWLPDVFGYSPCLPQIMRGFGVDYFFTTKLGWSADCRFPHSSFIWRGHDGSEVLAHVSLDFGYNGDVDAPSLNLAADQHRQAGVHPEVLMPRGWGDGGGGLTEDILEQARRLSNITGVPRTRWGRIEDFFDRMAQLRDDLPTYQGEVFLEYHRGVQTTHHRLKAAFRDLEVQLKRWEAVRSVTGQGPVELHPWRRVVFAQFHDYIPGSSVWEVYEEGLPELEALAQDCQNKASSELSEPRSKAECLFNTLPMPVKTLTQLKDRQAVVQLPPLSGVEAEEASVIVTSAQYVHASERRLHSDCVDARFDNQGRITKLIVDGQTLALDAPLNDLRIFDDHPSLFPAWDIDRYNLSQSRSPISTSNINVQGDESISAQVSFDLKLTEKSSATITYRLDAMSKVLRVSVDLDWQDTKTLLKAIFPTSYAGQNARFAAPFGSTLRGQQPGELKDETKFETPASRWGIVSDDSGQGMALITKNKFGMGAYAGMLHLSLIRSAHITDDTLQKALRSEPAPEFSDLGQHHIEYAISLVDAATPSEMQPANLADTLFIDPLPYKGKAISSVLESIDNASTLSATWAKPAATDDEQSPKTWTLRLNETMGSRGQAHLVLAKGATATPVDLKGEIIGKPLPKSKHGFKVDYEPYELLSLLITP